MNRAAVRYAKAILNLAQEQKVGEAVESDMNVILDTVKGSNELNDFLQSPMVKPAIKKASLLEIFKDTQGITKGLFDILVKNKRVGLLTDVAQQYQLLFDKLNGKEEATVTTAVPLTNDLKQKVLAKVKQLTGNDASLENVVDESIIGGFILKVGDYQYNASIASKLTTLRRELSN